MENNRDRRRGEITEGKDKSDRIVDWKTGWRCTLESEQGRRDHHGQTDQITTILVFD